jgi:hypothetical protein
MTGRLLRTTRAARKTTKENGPVVARADSSRVRWYHADLLPTTQQTGVNANRFVERGERIDQERGSTRDVRRQKRREDRPETFAGKASHESQAGNPR